MSEPLKIEDIIKLNKEKGFHFFDETIMKAYNSRVLSAIFIGNVIGNEQAYFVISEKNDEFGEERSYCTYKISLKTGEVTVAVEEPYDTAQKATTAAKALAGYDPKISPPKMRGIRDNYLNIPIRVVPSGVIQDNGAYLADDTWSTTPATATAWANISTLGYTNLTIPSIVGHLTRITTS
jgi:hypothetical protein